MTEEERAAVPERTVVLCDEETMLADAFADMVRERGLGAVAVVADVGAARQHLAATPAGTPPPLCLLELERRDGQLDPAVVADLAEVATVAVLTRSRDPRLRARALGAGARAYLTKEQPASMVLAAMERVCDPASRSGGIDPLLGFVAGPSPEPAAGLTSRERQVLQALVDGLRTDQIAAQLGIRQSTLRGYIQRVLAKLGVRSRAAAAAAAVERGLVRPGGRGRPAAD